MAKITSFDKTTCPAVGKRMLELLKPLEQEFGITVDYRGGTFDASGGEYTPKVVMKVGGGDKKVWDQYCDKLNLLPGHFGKEFIARGNTYVISGIQINRSKPIIATQKATGKRFMFPAEMLRKEFKRQYDWER
jgi:hypothetical protein